VRERVLASGKREVRAYYDRLRRESRVLARFTPYDEGADPVPFSFDLSYNYYPPEYHRPGPAATIYRLRDCKQAYGAPPIRIPETHEPPPDTPEEEVRWRPRSALVGGSAGWRRARPASRPAASG
jgi:hypothetical protein